MKPLLSILLGLSVALAAPGCGPKNGSGPTPTTGSGPGAAGASSEKPDGAALEKKLGSKKPEAGWAAAGKDRRAAIAAFAEEYRAYIAGAKTVRRAVTSLSLMAREAGAKTLPERGAKPKPGTRWILTRKGKNFALLVIGDAPPEEGLDLLVTPLDAPRLDLKREPGFRKEGFLLVETNLYGVIDIKSWLVTPLALYGYLSSDGEKPREIVVGEDPSDPVLVIPDLLPHLSRKAQEKIIIALESMDAVVGLSAKVTEDEEKDDAALLAGLAAWGVKAGDLEVGELSLVPAYAPTYIGVDRALIAAYGQAHGAQAYASVRAALKVTRPARSILVIGLDRGSMALSGDTGAFFLRHAVSSTLAAFGTDGAPTELEVRRVLARSRALLAGPLGGEVNGGVVLNPRYDDADPELVREVLNALDDAGVPYQFPDSSSPKGVGWSPSRRISTMGMRTMGMAVPIADRGAPMEVLSTLDLYDGYRAYRAFLERPAP